MNTLNYLFSNAEKISTLKKLGYAVKGGTTICTTSEYHDRVVEDTIKVMKVYKDDIEIPFNFQNVTERHMSHVNEIFFNYVKEALLDLVIGKNNDVFN